MRAPTIVGGPLPKGGVLVPEPGGTYNYSLGPEFFKAGDALEVSATGLNFPLFDVKITMPAPITLTSPGAPYTISIANDLVVTWTGGEPGARVFFSGGVGWGSFYCTLDATLGTGTIPKALFAPLQAGAGLVQWGQQNHTTLTIGASSVEVTATQLTESNGAYQ